MQYMFYLNVLVYIFHVTFESLKQLREGEPVAALATPLHEGCAYIQYMFLDCGNFKFFRNASTGRQ